MQKFKVLIEGYARCKNEVYYSSSSTILITDGSKKILVDPGKNSILLNNSLKKEGLNSHDIDIIFITHYHPDHFLNIRLFPEKDIYDGTTIWRGDKEITYSGYIPGTKIQVFNTPGHSPEQASLLIKTKEFGRVCIAQDLFWWEDGKQKSKTVKDLLNLKDPFASDSKALQKSRKLVLSKADYIIPGHGKMFKSPSKK